MPSWTGRRECLKDGRRRTQGQADEGLTPKQEIKAIDDAMTHSDENFLAQYGGFGKAMEDGPQRSMQITRSESHGRGKD